MKYFLWFNGIYDRFVEIPPTSMKKFVTTKGNAKKDQIYAKYVEETGLNLVEKLNYEAGEITSPLSDIADSYFLCKMAFDEYQLKKKKEGKKDGGT